MLIRMRTGLSGPEYNLQAGDEREFPDDEAIRLIKAGYAVPVGGVAIETAVQQPPAEIRTADEPVADEPVTEEPPAEPFGGKGDHDSNGKVGGAKRPGKRR